MSIEILTTLAASALCLLFSIHVIPERHLGVYFRGGALMNTTTEAGYHMKIPFITRHEEVLFAVQTDSVQNVPCGTASGVLINFAKIEVVNKLKKEMLLSTIRNYTVNYDKTWIYDKIHHEVNQFCSKHTLQEVYITLFNQLDDHLAKQLQDDISRWAPGIEIISVRVTKPTVPANILHKFEQVETEVTNLQIATNLQLVQTKQAETSKLQATIKAREEAEIAEIKNAQAVAAKKAQQEIQQIENQVHLDREKALADAALYREQKQAEANDILFTDNYLKLEQIKAQASISKIYFGEKIPSVFFDDLSSRASQPSDSTAKIAATLATATKAGSRSNREDFCNANDASCKAKY